MSKDEKSAGKQMYGGKIPKFFGMTEAGFAMIEYKKKVILAAGFVCERKWVQTLSTKQVRLLVPHARTPNYLSDAKEEKRFPCICNLTGKKFFFKGRLLRSINVACLGEPSNTEMPTRMKTVDHAPQLPLQIKVRNSKTDRDKLLVSKKNAASTVTVPHSNVTSCTNDGANTAGKLDGKVRKKRATTDSYELQVELAALFAACKAGFDPDVKMRHFVTLSQESDKTLYRKMAIGRCPKPVKRGKSSFWKMSEINAYIAGTWTAPT